MSKSELKETLYLQSVPGWVERILEAWKDN